MPSMRLFFFALVAVLGLPVDRAALGEAFRSPTTGEVRFIYLVPSDRSISSIYPSRIAEAAHHFQSWLGKKLEGRTVRLGHPAVRILRSDKPARWFSAVDQYRGFDAFYRNALDELTRLGAAKLNDPEARYVVYVDADHACGQSGAGGNGLAVVSANDLRGISGEAVVPACEKANGAEIAGRCRWIGGMGHELLHTLGLRHPDRSPACQTSQCRSEALMMQGYITYPNAVLLDEETASLQRSPFIQAGQINRLAECSGP
ncbi:hypothetical protein ACLBXB_20240 [Methylobacterium mesophilicum]